MADVTITYQGTDIVELSDSATKTLKTGGTYCEDDITLAYTKPSGGSGLENNIPQMYVYVYDNGTSEYKDITGNRVSHKDCVDWIKANQALAKDGIKNVYGTTKTDLSAAKYLYYLQDSGAGSSQNLMSVGNKVSVYSAKHIGFSSTDTLNAETDYAMRDLIPVSFTASGQTPNYTTLCNGYCVSQLTISVSNPTNEDFVVKSIYLSTNAALSAVQTSTTCTGAEHCT